MQSVIAILKVALLSTSFVGAAVAQNVVLYSSNNPETIANAVSLIRAKNSTIKVQPVTGGTGTLTKRIQAESASPGGDIFWSGGFGTLATSTQLMQPYESAEQRAIGKQFIGANNSYVGTNVHVMVLMVNDRQLKGLAVPKTWSDIMKPEWKGRFVLTDPSKSGTAFIQLYGILKQFGRDGLEKIAQNAVVVQSAGQVYKSVAAGEYAAGITLESAAYEFVVGGQKEIKLVYPSEGTYLGPEGMFLIKGAKNLEAAKKVYDTLLSKAAQEALLRDNFRRPTRTDIQVAKLTTMPDLSRINVYPLNLSIANDEYEQLIALWNLAVAKVKR